jgi:hypothetical protein
VTGTQLANVRMADNPLSAARHFPEARIWELGCHSNHYVRIAENHALTWTVFRVSS